VSAGSTLSVGPEQGSRTAAGKDPTVRMFWLFAGLHLVIWTVAPFALYRNLPLDCVEMHFWGQQWEWGYHKHPPLPAWVTRAVTLATGGSPAGVYLAAQACVVASFWAAWRLGREMLCPKAALTGAVLLECCYYYNYDATVFNNNLPLYAFWALAILCFHRALETARVRYWLALGACLGLGFLTKYTIGILAATMLGFLMVHSRARPAWRRPGPYLAALVALVLASPHVVWAWTNGFPTLDYAAKNIETTTGLAGHALHPLRFLAAQAIALLPIVVVCLPLTGSRWTLRKLDPCERFPRDFLVAFTLGPLVLCLILSTVLNLKLRSMWGCCLWTFAGTLLLFCFNLCGERRRWQYVHAGCALVGLLLAGALVTRIVAGGHAGRSHRELFAGKALADEVEAIWRHEAAGPLPVVAGEGWLAGNVSFYGSSHASVYGVVGKPVPPTDPQFCGWMDDRRLVETGGVYLWDATQKASLPRPMRVRFPHIRVMDVITLPYSIAAVPAERIGVAIIPKTAPPSADSLAGRPTDSAGR
jgi:hypothetical protein